MKKFFGLALIVAAVTYVTRRRAAAAVRADVWAQATDPLP
ncbi:MAG: DLW-39 family protein [Propionibacteriaceae bacterium]